MAKQGKRYRAAAAEVDHAAVYTPHEAVSLARRISNVGFDETVELHIRLGVDPRHADQQVRGVALLPNGLGKTVRVLVFALGEGETIARDAGADYTGGDELIKRVEEGFLEFDSAIATPEIMGRIGRLGRILGRRGLMPNPRAGTVVAPEDLPRAVQEARQGKVEFRLDRTGIIHAAVGKVSFEDEQLLQNIAALLQPIIRARPETVRAPQYLKSIDLATSMGPGLRLDLAAAVSLQAE